LADATIIRRYREASAPPRVSGGEPGCCEGMGELAWGYQRSVHGVIRGGPYGESGVAVTNVTNDPLDVSLHDHELHDEVTLTTQLIIAASDEDEHLSQAAIDRLLGVSIPSPFDPAGHPSPEPSDE
jgi:hypothetical protein